MIKEPFLEIPCRTKELAIFTVWELKRRFGEVASVEVGGAGGGGWVVWANRETEFGKGEDGR